MIRENYEKLAVALQAMIQHFDPTDEPSRLQREIDRILDLAEKIGSPLQEEVAEFKKEYERYLKNPQHREVFLKKALRLEQEAREI